MDTLSGIIDHIIYSNKDNGYTVFELKTDTGTETCVGILHAAGEGESVKLSGEYANHNLYGKQFSFSEFEVTVSQDETAILKYLSSGAVKGIGQSLAQRIVDAFGKDAIRVMEEEPELLSRIKGISLRKAQEISAEVIEKQDLRKVMVFLQKFGISNNLAAKIYKRYGNSVYKIIEENPYRLADDIDGVGFKTADEIAGIAGIEVDSGYRIKSGIMYILSGGVAEGHIYLPKDILLRNAQALLLVEKDNIWVECENLSMDRKVIIQSTKEEIRVYAASFYHMEKNCARMLAGLDVVLLRDAMKVRKCVEQLKSSEDEELSENQLDAVTTSITCGVSVITGGPGTGKTTAINRIIQYLKYSGEDFALAAPTGRAAKRMTETTGYEASTIQRLLGLSVPGLSEGGYSYEYNEDNPLELDTLIVDEMSMVDLPLFYALLKAVAPGTRLIMVGDTDQLPSVGPGSVLKDIIASECIPVTKLTRIFRQSGKSDIVTNAHKINEGLMPDISNKSRDFFFLQRDDAQVVLSNTITLIKEKLPGYVGATPLEIQVLTPMRKGNLGVEGLNPVLQKYLNPPMPGKTERQFGSVLYREGDKVMQTKNNYRIEWEVLGKYDIPVEQGLGVFNGDIGVIKKIDSISETVSVLYDDNHLVTYPFSNVDEFELAYAVTIHKSQGSEYPAVVIPLLSGPRPLLNRNLLYTAVTRARKCVTIIGSANIIEQMVQNGDELKRYTSLEERIREVCREENL